MKFNESLFQKFVPLFETRGLDESNYSDHNGGLEFIRNAGDVCYRITIDMSISTRGFVDIYGEIGIQSVSQHLGKIIQLKSDFEPLLINYDLYQDKEDWTRIWRGLSSMPLKLNKQIEEFQQAIMDHVDSYILPFFEKYPDLQAVNDKMLNVIPEKDYSDYIPGLQKNLKVLIIMRLCGNPKYDEFRDWALDAYKRGVEIDANKYGQGLKDIQKLVAYLESEDVKKD